MSRTRMTPPLEISGRFEAIAPYNTLVIPGAYYTCVAVRLFVDCEADGEDVYTKYYQPVSLPNSEYSLDKTAGAAIVTLRDPDGRFVELPDTFVASYPKMGAAKYHHVVLAISLGPLPETVQLDNLKANLTEMVSGTIGVENKVIITAAPSSGVISDTEHEAMETARLAAITNRTTTKAELFRSQQQVLQMQERINVYEEILRANGLMPT